MADPTLNGFTLSTGGSHSRHLQPRARVSTSALPSVDGAFTKRYGRGERLIVGRGVMKEESYAVLKSVLRDNQESANMAPATYVDVDGTDHANCILLSYDQSTDINRESDSSYWVQVAWRILKQSPTL